MELTLGVAAHVDAGKTTLCERILERTGVLRRFGRVDHGDAFLDDSPLERARGVTIYGGQASFSLTRADGTPLHVTLMDTPGHVDFAGETERALGVLDAALLVVSCAEGVQSHTQTLLRMLRARGIPTLIFLNKTDREGADRERVAQQLARRLSADCVPLWQEHAQLAEELAARDEALLERHCDGEAAREDYLAGARRALTAGTLFPVLSGSAMTGEGVETLLEAVAALCGTDYEQRLEQPFSARVYRVRRADGVRMTYLKAMQGRLAPREVVATPQGERKADAIYAVQGARLSSVSELRAGQTAAVAGLLARPGEIVGEGAGSTAPELVPVMSVEVEPVPPLDRHALLAHLRELEDEDPLLAVRAERGMLEVGVMGEVQIEVLESVLKTRFGDSVVLTPPRTLYRETIAAPAVGVGHYEPLRHYAEVWLLLEPGEPGSGVTFTAACPPNTLELNWQRLIGTHVLEREHPGVLTGSPLTDVRVTLLAGRAHLKHTEGGDFREATYRAIRHALMNAQSVLLEPTLRFELAMPSGALARVTGELLRMGAELDAPQTDSEETTLSGECAAAAFWGFPSRYAALTRGLGRLSSRFERWSPCRNQEEIVRERGYAPLADEANPAGSVFCSHGAGVYVAWDHVREWAHGADEAQLAQERLVAQRGGR
ncbi:MAG: TetM/TetW/TetO/TetS family tetracycline resistance ribosomal protection protein [Clostridiales bacterium]|nr:TetM/TetW/TetO/TetS family tetracycline resistance ribosomal protection protein [Clostridiales bacterium]